LMMDLHGGLRMTDEPEDFQASPEFFQRLARRERDAIATLARECVGPLLDYLRKTRGRHGQPKDEWNDIVQHVLAKFIAHDVAQRLDPGRPLLPYMRQMVLNRARDQAKK